MKNFSFNKAISVVGLAFALFVVFTVISNPPMVQRAYGQVGLQNGQPVLISSASSKANPCLAAWSPMSSTVVNISTAVATELVPAVAGRTVYACGFRASVSAADVLTFEAGTVTSCGTPVAKTGAFAVTGATNGPIEFLGATNTAQSASGGDFCVLTTTTGSVQGVFLWQQF